MWDQERDLANAIWRVRCRRVVRDEIREFLESSTNAPPTALPDRTRRFDIPPDPCRYARNEVLAASRPPAKSTSGY
jgi:hypothetical protein